MRKKILVKGPALSLSGYGEQTRFALRSLRAHEDLYDIYLIPTAWGHTGWLSEDNEERRWIDHLIHKASASNQDHMNSFDMSLQVTIPNEWEPVAPFNVGYTAGIETTKVSTAWLEKTAMIDTIITTSQHSKSVFANTTYEGIDRSTNQKVQLTCQAPIEVVGYPVREYDPAKLDLDLKYDFNFLSVAQMGPRKNIGSTIRWWIEEFYDQPVGLVVKLFWHNNSTVDRHHTIEQLQHMLEDYEERKCKVYLLHGDMTNEEMTALYQHPKIKALVSLSHGEGFGLPLFEAAYSNLPVITTDWSGQSDFLNVKVMEKQKKSKKRREVSKSLFAKVDYTMGPIPEEAVWDTVLERESMWAYADQGSYKMVLRDVYKNYDKYTKMAQKLQKYVLKEYTAEKQYKKFIEAMDPTAFSQNKEPTLDIKKFV
tara:strand:+ start:965 stop:2239 length:1275 start_codon:yes stop_codon:yes gene_type:complete